MTDSDYIASGPTTPTRRGLPLGGGGEMKKSEVQIGAVYLAKVSGKLARVKITCAALNDRPRDHGWIGLNLDTHREVRIKNPARLLREVCPAESRALDLIGRMIEGRV